MARETNKQRQEREDRETAEDRAERLSDARNTWTTRLMKNLDHVTKVGGVIQVYGDFFEARIPEEDGCHKSLYVSPILTDLICIDNMEYLEFELAMVEADQAKARAIQAARVSGWNKLNELEREAFGIK